MASPNSFLLLGFISLSFICPSSLSARFVSSFDLISARIFCLKRSFCCSISSVPCFEPISIRLSSISFRSCACPIGSMFRTDFYLLFLHLLFSLFRLIGSMFRTDFYLIFFCLLFLILCPIGSMFRTDFYLIFFCLLFLLLCPIGSMFRTDFYLLFYICSFLFCSCALSVPCFEPISICFFSICSFLSSAL